MRRRWPIVLGILVLLAGAAWRWQSEIIGVAAGWYMQRIAAGDVASGDLGKRRQAVAGMHRLLLMPPPPDAMVAELFELMTLLSRRAATGEISFNWAAYVYTSYYRDLVRDRPTGSPARDTATIAAELDRYVRFYALQKRPDRAGVRVSDLLGGADEDTYTLEEIDQAAAEGRELPLR